MQANKAVKKRHSNETRGQIIAKVKAGLKKKMTVTAACHAAGISTPTYYAWINRAATAAPEPDRADRALQIEIKKFRRAFTLIAKIIKDVK